MKTKNNIPAYRFQGYTDAWELRKLGEVSSHRGGTAIENYFSEDGKYKVISIGSYGLDNKYVDQNIRAVENEVTRLRVVNKNELTMVLNDKTANGNIIGRCLLIETDDEFVINQRTEIINFDNEVNPKFAYVVLNGVFREQVKKIVQGGTQIYVNYSSVEQLSFSLPTLPEQKAIGTFFSTLDQQITLHQRKLDTLKEQKKAYLKLLFPAKGQTKPALRFQGFEDDWELRKLGDVVEKSGSGGTPKSTNKSYYGGNIPFLSITDITQSGKYITNTEKTLTELGLENSSAWIVPKGAISLAMYASVGKLAILKTDVATSQAFFNMVFSNEIVRDYVYFILDKAQLFNEWLPLISTGTQGNLNAQKLKEYSIPLPSFPEQEAIGTFFQTLDQEITQQESKLDSLKEMKKTLLRKMFV